MTDTELRDNPTGRLGVPAQALQAGDRNQLVPIAGVPASGGDRSMLAERTRRAQFLLGGRQARHIAPAILLGVTAGAVCGWNLTFASLVTLAFWLNTPLVLLASSAVAGLAMALFCENLSTTIGRALLDKCDLGSAFYAFAPGPTAALFGLDDYRLVGNLGLGMLVGIPAAHALSRLMCRVPVGDDEPEPAAADPLLRPLGFVVATACVGCTVGALHTLGPQLVGQAVLERLTAAVGAPVSVDRFDYDLWRGELEITNLRIGDARDGRTVFTARRVEGRVEPGLFLRGRLHAEEFAVGGVSFDLSASTRSEKALAMYARRPSILKDSNDLPAAPVDPTADVEVQTMLRHVSKTNDRLAALAAAIGQVEWIADLEAPHTAGGKRLDLLVRRKAAPRDGASGRAAPLVKLKQVRIDGVAEFTELGPKTQITLTNLTSRPSTAARHAQLTLADEESSFRLQTTFHLADPERQHAVTFELSDVAGADLLNATAIHAFDVRNSRVEIIRGNGTATRDRFDIRLLVMARGVRGASTTGLSAGVDVELLGEALARLPTVQLALKAEGRWSQPRLSLSPSGALRDLKTLLRANGAGDLANAIETGKRPVAVNPTTKGPTPSTPDVLAAGPLDAKSLGVAPVAVYPPASKPLAGLVTGVPPTEPAKPATIVPPPATTATLPATTTLPTAAAQPAPSLPAPSILPPASTPAPKTAVIENPTVAANLAAALPAARQVGRQADPAAANGRGANGPESGAPSPSAPAPSTNQLPAVAASMPANDKPPTALGGTPLVQRTAHTVAERPTGAASGRSSTVMASDEFSTTPAPAAVPAAGPAPRPSRPQLTQGLRQPNSVLTPSAAPGSVELETGPELKPASSRNATYGPRPETKPSRYPSAALLDTPTADRGRATEPSLTTQRSLPSERGPAGSERFAGDAVPAPRNLPTLPRRSLITRDGTEPLPRGAPYERSAPYERGASALVEDGTAYDIPSSPKPEKKKSIFSGVTKLFGKPEPVIVEDRPYSEPTPNTYSPPASLERRPAAPPADRIASPKTEAEPANPGFFRSLFGSKPKAESRFAETPAEPKERGLFGGSKQYDAGKPAANSKSKSRGIFGSKTSAVKPAAASDERDFATTSGYTTDAEFDASASARVPTAEYEAPVGVAPGAVPAGGSVPRATDLESPRTPERVSAGLPWYKQMIR